MTIHLFRAVRKGQLRAIGDLPFMRHRARRGIATLHYLNSQVHACLLVDAYCCTETVVSACPPKVSVTFQTPGALLLDERANWVVPGTSSGTGSTQMPRVASGRPVGNRRCSR